MYKLTAILVLVLATVPACKGSDRSTPAPKATEAAATAPVGSTVGAKDAPGTEAAQRDPKAKDGPGGAAAVRKPPVAAGTQAPAGNKSAGAVATAKPALIPIRNAKIYRGMLLGGQPTEAQFRAAAQAGYGTIINLRTSMEPGVAEAPALMESLGLKYVAIPVAGAAGMTEANAQALSQALAAAKGPVMVHCASGNRVGALIGLMAHHAEGASPKAAFDIAQKAGMTSLTPVVRAQLGL